MTVADNEAIKDADKNKMMQFSVGPKFEDAINNAIVELNTAREKDGEPKLSTAAFLRETVASAINFNIALDPITTRTKYANDAERKAAIAAQQKKAAEDRKKITKLINMAKQKSNKQDAIAALMASLNITDADLE